MPHRPSIPLRAGTLLALCLATAAVRAQDRSEPPAPAPEHRPAPGGGLGAPADLPLPSRPGTEQPKWEGALGLNISNRPEYEGASLRATKFTPALFLRYGRFTITNASGFVTRRSDDVVRGFGADLLQGDRVRVNLALRFDAGRSESTSSQLAGLGDVKRTVRARLNASWRLADGWRAGASWSVDAFGRGGGNFGDVSFGREFALDGTVVGVGASLSVAGDRYLQTYYGVTPEQSARSGLRVYSPGAGLRDAGLAITARRELGHDWVVLGGAGATRLLGPAADSPLTRSATGWAVNLGFARRL